MSINDRVLKLERALRSRKATGLIVYRDRSEIPGLIAAREASGGLDGVSALLILPEDAPTLDAWSAMVANYTPPVPSEPAALLRTSTADAEPRPATPAPQPARAAPPRPQGQVTMRSMYGGDSRTMRRR